MDTLYYNLTSGTSYLTQQSDAPAAEGKILYHNMTAVAAQLFGEEYTDDDMETVIDCCSNGVLNDVIYDEDCDIDAAVEAIDAWAKRRGGRGWL